MASLLHSLLERLHLSGQCGAELVQDVVVDLIVLVVDFGLNGAIADLESTEKDEVLGRLKRASAHCDLI